MTASGTDPGAAGAATAAGTADAATGPGSPGGADDDAHLVQEWAEIVRALEAVQQGFAVSLDGLGLTMPYFQVLTVLYDAADHRLPMSRIARDLAMTSGGFTKLADRMARDGLIDRRGSAGDRRVVFAALTEAGSDAARRAVDAYRAFLRGRVLQVISEEELRTVSDIAARLEQVRLAQEPDPVSFELSPRTPDAPDRRTGR